MSNAFQRVIRFKRNVPRVMLVSPRLADGETLADVFLLCSNGGRLSSRASI
jgi:hypothetical protein